MYASLGLNELLDIDMLIFLVHLTTSEWHGLHGQDQGSLVLFIGIIGILLTTSKLLAFIMMYMYEMLWNTLTKFPGSGYTFPFTNMD